MNNNYDYIKHYNIIVKVFDKIYLSILYYYIGY